MSDDKRKPAPLSATEKFNQLNTVFGTRKLARIMGTKTTHLMAFGEGAAPITGRRLERMNTLHDVVKTLSGNFNQIGTHDWFEKKRDSLGHKSARQVLEATPWRKGDTLVKRIKKLAKDATSQPNLMG